MDRPDAPAIAEMIKELDKTLLVHIQRFEIATGMRVRSIKIHPGKPHMRPRGTQTYAVEVIAQVR